MTLQLRVSLLTALLLTTAQTCATAQAHAGTQRTTPAQIAWLVHSAIEAELAMVAAEGVTPLRYRTTKRDAKGTTVRDVINTRQGPVARLIERDGQALTAEQNNDERSRLRQMLADPDIVERHIRRSATDKEYSTQLLRALPDALIFTLAPGQPQSTGAPGPETVLDFVPNPKFHPPSTVTESLRNIEGRISIDTATGHMVRLQGRVRAATDIGLGILARIYPGGTVLFQQQPVADGRWAFSHLDAHLVIRELLLHKQTEDTTLYYTGYTTLPGPVDWRQAVDTLLRETVTTR